MKKLFKIMLVAAMVVTGMAVSQHAKAQTKQPPGGITVTVKENNSDPNAEGTSPLKGVEVTVKNLGTGDTFSQKTGEDGKTIFSNLAPGTYEVSFSYVGYLTIKFSGIIVVSNQIYSLSTSMIPA